MKILTVKDDVFEFAQKECDAAIIWMRSGFNLLHSKCDQPEVFVPVQLRV